MCEIRIYIFFVVNLWFWWQLTAAATCHKMSNTTNSEKKRTFSIFTHVFGIEDIDVENGTVFIGVDVRFSLSRTSPS